MKLGIAKVSCIALAMMTAGLAHAAKGDPTVLLSQGDRQVRSLSGVPVAPKGSVAAASVAGIQSIDAIDSATNDVLEFNIGAGNALTGISWDVGIETLGLSWVSEARVQFSSSTGSSDPNAINLTVGNGVNAPGNQEFSSGGVILFSSVPLNDITVGADGILRLQFFESYDDGPGADANWRDAVMPAIVAGIGLACTNQAACDAAVGGAPILDIGTVTAADSCLSVPANNNGIPEPGETLTFDIPLNATGGAFTNVVGTLSTASAGVSIVNGVGNYGTIADGSSGTASYSVRLDQSVACFSALNFTLNVASTEGNFSFPVTDTVGSAAITYAGLPAAIPDNTPAGVSSVANVANMAGPITSAQVRVNATHTWVGDIVITLTSPGGTTLTLLDRPGVPAGSFGCSNDNINVTFQDGAADPEAVCAASGAWPVTTAAPVNAFSALNGQAGNGNWTLTISDNAGGDTGQLVDWELILTPAPTGTCTVCPLAADLSVTLADAPDPVTAGTNLTYTAVVSNAGPDAAQNPTVTLPVPANTTFVSGTVSSGGSCAGSPVVCTLSGPLANGASSTITAVFAVSAAAPDGSTINGSATVASPTVDLNMANNTASTTTAVSAQADLSVAITASAAQVLVNVPVTFTATATNLGPSDAQNVAVSITLSPDFRYTGHTATGATCTVPQVGNSGVITCTWTGATAPAAQRVMSVVAYSNNVNLNSVRANVASATTDPVAPNNSAGVTVQVGELIEEIPTMGRTALLLLGLMLALGGIVAIRRHS